MKRIAIIGAGLSGLTLAEHLADHAEITLFDKFHQAGGRIASREYTPFIFDHGAQFFTVKHPEFAAFVEQLTKAGVVARWDARFVEIDGTVIKQSRAWASEYPHYVGVPSMSAIGKFLSCRLTHQGVTVHFNTPVTKLYKHHDQWLLIANDQILGSYDWVVTAMPAKQTVTLLPENVAYQQSIKQLHMLPCYALMLGFAEPLNLTWDAAHVANSLLSWVSVNSSKPNRHELTTLVTMSRNAWAAEYFNQPEEWVKQNMIEALEGIIGAQVQQHQLLHLKKWHFANAPKVCKQSTLVDTNEKIASCGDWCISGRIESAFQSAIALARALKQHI